MHNTAGVNGGSLLSLPELPRLKRLREAILHSPYHVCTQKSSLLTRYCLEQDPLDPLDRAISSLQYSFYRKSLYKSAKSVPQKRNQIRLNNRINGWLARRRRISTDTSMLRYAGAFKYILENMDLRVYDDELIVGNPSAWRVGAPLHADLGGLLMLPEIRGISTRKQNPMNIAPSQVRELEEEIFPYWANRSVLGLSPLYSNDPELFNTLMDGRYFILTQFSGISHVTPDYPTVLRLGFSGIRKRIESALEENEREMASLPNKGRDGHMQALESKACFYRAAITCAEAAINYGRRWSEFLTEAASNTADSARRAELLNLADIFRRVPAGPAKTFYEALQSVFITHTMLHYESFQHGISFGRMDQYLYPYFKSDIGSNRLTYETAAELIGCFLCKAGELLPLFFDRATEYFSGLSSASGITLGGSSAGGADCTNELSYLFLLAYDQVRLRQPNLHVRVHEGTPPQFMDLCCEVLKKGGGLPAFFNDGQVPQALEKAGISKEDAFDYSIVGCVEWGVPGRSFPAAGAAFINIPMALHLALHNGRSGDKQYGPETGDPAAFKSMDEVLEAFRLQLEHLVQKAVDGNNAIEKAHALSHPTPFLSAVVDGCIEKGVEITNGGAKYNSTGCQGVGLADAVDSLAAIEELVFRQKKVDLPSLVAVVDGDFKAQPELRAYILNKLPKYGMGEPLPDKYAGIVSGQFGRAVSSKSNARGGRYYAGFWSMTTHQGFGARMGALPGGRATGAPLANGISPCNGRDLNGPTASLSSAAGLDNGLVANGYALNQKLDLSMLRKPNGNMLVDGLVRGFFASGGMQVQFNILDPQVLIDARDHPDMYPSLVVRVSGYSAYFNDLTDSMKNELIERTLHELTSCSC